MRLLLVDDDAGFRELLRTTFEAVEVEVDDAGSAAEAEERIAAARPDVIVLDVGMPGMDGLEVLARLRAMTDGLELPVVMLTAAADDANAWRAWSGGVDYFLGKPFDADQLLRYLDHLFAGALSGR